MGPHFPIWLQYQKNYFLLDISDNGISDSVPKWFWELSSDFQILNTVKNFRTVKMRKNIRAKEKLFFSYHFFHHDGHFKNLFEIRIALKTALLVKP